MVLLLVGYCDTALARLVTLFSEYGDVFLSGEARQSRHSLAHGEKLWVKAEPVEKVATVNQFVIDRGFLSQSKAHGQKKSTDRGYPVGPYRQRPERPCRASLASLSSRYAVLLRSRTALSHLDFDRPMARSKRSKASLGRPSRCKR
jgi:hypothetical protein